VCRVEIGAFTLFGPGVQIDTPVHPLNAERRRQQEFGKPVTIGADVWVGGGAMISPACGSAPVRSSAPVAS
jgi:maltose O-acetyltransferase